MTFNPIQIRGTLIIACYAVQDFHALTHLSLRNIMSTARMISLCTFALINIIKKLPSVFRQHSYVFMAVQPFEGPCEVRRNKYFQ